LVMRGAGVGDGLGEPTGVGAGVGVWANVLRGNFVAAKPAPSAGSSFTKVRLPTRVFSLRGF